MIVTKPGPCLYCGEVQDALTPLDGRDELPRPGDMTICVSCGSLLVFNAEMGLRRPTTAELRAVVAVVFPERRLQ